ncbi:hypothetical protein OGAPHI_005614 [Ogataea philodendri]|uniref:Lysophospholipase NTE1 n=1 Tax=Ogataea philodendri TaxID=1378263 RepID=A0A9P8NZH1_9ASCO|nr:uncharacterized protein OGAPHI_005614 [Ogataea philodendri]KAH3662362.1 hypothetical protein OGAPHI_005614 [Ogataea philodendri]
MSDFVVDLSQQMVVKVFSLLASCVSLLSWTLYSIVSYIMQIALSFSTVLIVAVLVSLATYAYIHYKYLTVYSRLPEDPKRQEPLIDTFLENAGAEHKSRLNYLDEFLSAIKIFGYLESQVFNELTKSMQTQKLDSGEIVLMDEDSGFTICVEGEIEVFCKIGSSSDENAIFINESSKNYVIVDNVKYRLLNNVKSGAPLSSLTSVLNLLTSSDPPSRTERSNSEGGLPVPSDFALDNRKVPESPVPPVQSAKEPSPLIAIPKNNCTISIIPKESFARLAYKYPKATSHIVQMILTKLYRVTFQTAHDYLGLTPDIMRTEINLNERYTNVLPPYLREDVVEHFQPRLSSYSTLNESASMSRKTLSSRSRFPRSESAHSNPVSRSNSPRASGSYKTPSAKMIDSFSSDADDSNQSDDMLPLHRSRKSLTKMNGQRMSRPKSARQFTLLARNSTNPGDLLTNAPLSQMDKVDNIEDKDILFLRDKVSNNGSVTDQESIVRATIASSICETIGVDRGLLSFSSPGRRSFSSSVLSSPLITAMSIVKPDPKISKGAPNSKIRTFSSTQNRSDALDNGLESIESSRKSYMDFENIKGDIANAINLKQIPAGTKIIEANEHTPGIYYVIEGCLRVTYMNKNTDSEPTEEFIYDIKEGGIAGYLGTLIGSKSFVDITAQTGCYVAFVQREVFEILNERFPYLQLAIAKNLLRILDRRLLLADYAMEWVHTSAGDSLYSQGDPANGIYIVLNGRFRSLKTLDNNDQPIIASEHGQGESLGEVEVLTKIKRSSTVVAIRDSELARIPRSLFEMIALSNPSIMVKVTRIVANRFITSKEQELGYESTGGTAPIKEDHFIKNFNNYRTITILPVTYGLPVLEFGERLATALENVNKSTKMLTQSTALSRLGKHAFDHLAKLKQSGYFSELEDKYDIVTYLVDTPVNSSWTKTCIQQGDCILLLADSQRPPDIGEFERLLVKNNISARTELILLHPQRYVEPGLTNSWLKNRIWVHSHHHVQLSYDTNAVQPQVEYEEIPKSLNTSKLLSSTTAKLSANLKNILNSNEFIQLIKQTRESFKSKKYYRPMQEHKDDFMRLARILTGQAIGLVLGGGGARGISHIGVIAALEEKGIPVDFVGGTSIGAFVGALYAREYDLVPVYGRAKTFSGRMGSIWRSLLDLTIPLTSYTTGHEFNRGIWKAFGDSRIEDFWIKFYCNSTNITESVMEIHSSGYAWRYVRASMSLAALLPPLTDNGNMLLDGGYIDNLPVQEMKRRGANAIIACDVGSEDDRSKMYYGESLSGLWVLLNRLNPFSIHPNVPTMTDIQIRLAYVASVIALEKSKNAKDCVYLRPPIEGYATLDFSKFDEIYKVGSRYATTSLNKLEESGELPQFKTKRRELNRNPTLQRRNSI